MPLLLRPGFFPRFGGSERQTGHFAHHVALVVGEHPLEAIGVDHFFALIRWHGAQIPNCGSYHSLAIGGQLLHLSEDLTCLLLLFGSEVLPGLHTIQHAQLLLRWKVREVSQLPQAALLLFWRQLPKHRIFLQFAFLLIWRQIFVAPQPVARVALRLRSRAYLLLGSRRRARHVLLGHGSGARRRRRVRCVLLRHAEAGKHCGYRHQGGDGPVSGNVFSPLHDSRLTVAAGA